MTATHSSLIAKRCDGLIQKVRQVRKLLRSRFVIKNQELAIHLQVVQGQLQRFVALLLDNPEELVTVQQRHPSLIQEVIDLLHSAQKLLASPYPAVTASCQAIYDSLFAWWNLKQSSLLFSSVAMYLPEVLPATEEEKRLLPTSFGTQFLADSI